MPARKPSKRKPALTTAETRAAQIRCPPKEIVADGPSILEQLESERLAGQRIGIQLCRNLIIRREHDHLDHARDKWLFKGEDNLRADECTTILVELAKL